MTNRLYEGMFLFDAALAAKDWPGLEQHVHDLLKKHAAELVYSERWPDRKLAYEIEGCKKGTYYLTYFNAPAGALQGLQRDSQLSERILRLLVIYDKSLPVDCQKRLSREIQGSPEEIEERRERAKIGVGEVREGDEAPEDAGGPGGESVAARKPLRGEGRRGGEDSFEGSFDDTLLEKDSESGS